ncbi:carbon storage regulator CsrA [Paenibacillus sp. PL2-23]|uniref:carbon storage regulator CsrA n=1 Tax=Paenibacillus sp. PL2-23 TaxID=2100729 RepID=UPI0030FBEB0F
MLVLSRKKGQSIIIGNDIEITILEAIGDTVKIGIEAPSEVGVLRKELYLSIEATNIDAEQFELSAAELREQFSKLKSNG